MQTFLIIIIFISLFFYGYLRWLRPRHLKWESKDQEVEQLMLDDEIVGKPKFELRDLLGL